MIPLPGLTLPPISLKCVWKICLTINVSKSVFVIVIALLTVLNFHIFFCYLDLEMTLLYFSNDFGVILINNSSIFEHLTYFWNTKIVYKYVNTQFLPFLAWRVF